jgi:hypothetical protein
MGILKNTMKLPLQIFAPLAVGLCAFAACNAHADSTNFVTFTATTFSQGSTNAINGTNTSFAAGTTKSHNTAEIVQELGSATGHSFTSAAKLALINGTFIVMDGATVVDVSDIISLRMPGENRIRSGTKNGQTGLAFPTVKDLQIVELDFDDTSFQNGSHLNFFLIGLANTTTTDTTPGANGIYTETFKGKVTSMTGEGSNDSGPFVATGSLTVTGKSVLSL